MLPEQITVNTYLIVVYKNSLPEPVLLTFAEFHFLCFPSGIVDGFHCVGLDLLHSASSLCVSGKHNYASWNGKSGLLPLFPNCYTSLAALHPGFLWLS